LTSFDMFAAAILLAATLMLPASSLAQTAAAPLTLETKIPLGRVSGRIDHLAIDLKRRRLLVAELGNNSIGVVDLAAGRARPPIAGFREPQGVGYIGLTDSVYVANGGDGSVRVLSGGDLTPVGRIDLGEDADNVRVDQAHRQVLIGYGSAIAFVDPSTRTRTGDIKLDAHPEGFQIDGDRLFVNVPEAHAIVFADLTTGASRSIPTPGAAANFPMAVNRAADRVLVVFRRPPLLMALSGAEGRVVSAAATCGDADDLFVDDKRRRVYVSCGEGAVDVFAIDKTGDHRLARVPTVSGARTSLFVPELDRLFVAVRATAHEPAAIWVFRPTP
jgi:DNA-binding beta-propeller fold protein YncE